MGATRFVRLAVLVAALAAALAASSTAGVSDSPSIVTDPTWSPDGAQVAFAYTGSSTYRIVAAPVSGAGPTRTVYAAKNLNGCCDPMLWSPAGRILFDTNFTLRGVSPTGGRPITLARNVSWFILSPNGRTVAFDGPQGRSPSGIGLVAVRGGKPRPVVRPAQASDGVTGFSPDGTELVFFRSRSIDSGPTSFMVEHVRGGVPVPLGRSGLIGASHLPAGSVEPQWSPDGRWIAFVHLGKLEVVSAAGAATPHTVAGWVSGAFSWSPSSKLLACFCGPNREHVRLTTLNPQGTKRTVLWANRSLHYITENTGDLPRWSPDGSKLAFLARVGRGFPPIQVWVVGADGAGLKRIA